MKIVDLEQGSTEWLYWRKKGIGASESPIILGLSPYTTQLELYREKKGITRSEGNWATARGHLMEPTARLAYENHTGIRVRPITVEHDDISYLRASLDGWSDKHQMLVELKYPGKKDWELAEKGELPDHYYYQVQHQMLVTGTAKAHYFAFNGEYGRLIVVEENLEAQAEIVAACREFKRRLEENDMPPLTDRDTKIMQITSDMAMKLNMHARLKASIKLDQKCLKSLEEQIAAWADHPRCQFGDLHVTKFTRRGAVDLAAVKKNLDVDLEKYRKKDTVVCQFRYPTEKNNDAS